MEYNEERRVEWKEGKMAKYKVWRVENEENGKMDKCGMWSMESRVEERKNG
jgi:hypothetical protein